MKKFELWLDESGDFDNDINKAAVGANPSLIGGLLVETNSFPDTIINSIIPESDTYHSVNETDQLIRFKKIEEKLFKNDTNRIVIFTNQECVMIVDNNRTYLNIMSAGIIQLLKHLKSMYGKVHLHVIIANRVDTTTGLEPNRSVVPVDEYVIRLKEKLTISGIDGFVDEGEWQLTTASARKNKKLMLADIICNTFYTRYKRSKFNDEERRYIENIYLNNKKTQIFSVFESVLEKKFKDNLLENRIGEAVVAMCLSKDKSTIQRCFDVLNQNIASSGFPDVRLQYRFISAYIEYYINIVRDFDICINFLSNLLYFYIPLLQAYKNDSTFSMAARLETDIKFYLFTVYTHMGNINMAGDLERQCEEAIKQLPPSLETANYRIKFTNRKINNQINNFDYDNALLEVDKLVNHCRTIKEGIELIIEDENCHYDELGKALGSRLQIKTLLLRKRRELYQSAVGDSNEAITEFISENDKKRQYLYRVHLETDYQNYDEALLYLRKSVGLSQESDIKSIWYALVKESIFGVMAFVRLMAEGYKWNQSSDMYKVLSESGYIKELEDVPMYHPVEIILWKYAYYCEKNGSYNAAIDSYERALSICFSSDDTSLNAIGMGIEFELFSVLLKHNKKKAISHKKIMQKRWNKMEETDGEILNRIFGKVDFTNDTTDYYWDLSREVTY